MSEEGLQIAVKRREVKSKGDKERYTHLNAEFQRIAGKDKKAFLSDHEIAFHEKLGSIKDRKGMDLIEAEDIKRWQNTQKNYTKRSSQPR